MYKRNEDFPPTGPMTCIPADERKGAYPMDKRNGTFQTTVPMTRTAATDRNRGVTPMTNNQQPGRFLTTPRQTPPKGTIQPIKSARTGTTLPVFFIYDGSGSMDELISGNRTKYECAMDSLCDIFESCQNQSHLNSMIRAKVSVCGGNAPIDVLQTFTKLSDLDVARQIRGKWPAPRGCTPLGQSIMKSLDDLMALKGELSRNGDDYKQPLLCILTDGESTDDPDLMEKAKARVHDLLDKNKLTLITVGVSHDGADFPYLRALVGNHRNATFLQAKESRDIVEYVRLVGKTVAQLAKPVYITVPLQAFGGQR